MAQVTKTILAVAFKNGCKFSYCQSFEFRDLNVVCEDIDKSVDLESALVPCGFGRVSCLLVKTTAALAQVVSGWM